MTTKIRKLTIIKSRNSQPFYVVKSHVRSLNVTFDQLGKFSFFLILAKIGHYNISIEILNKSLKIKKFLSGFY